MAYINRHSKDYFTWSASQLATYWMCNEEESSTADEKLLGILVKHVRDACLESNVYDTRVRL